MNQKLRKLKEEKLRRIKEERHRYFTPNGKQEEFIQLNDFIRIFSAGNGVGKTALMCNIIASYANPGHNKYFNIEKRKTRGRIVSTKTNIQENIIPELQKWLFKGQYKTEKAGKVFESRWHTEWTDFDIMTYEQDPQEFESVTLDWIVFDEPPPYKIYAASVARFRFGGIIMMFMTPLSDSAWIYDELMLNDATQKGVVYAEVEDNCIEHGIRGILRHDDIERMIAEYTDDEREARTKGRFMHLAGLVYKEYNEKVHRIEPFDIPDDWTLYCALDPHPRTPHAVMWMAVDPQGTKYVVDELFCEGSPEVLAAKIKVKEHELGLKVRQRIIDPMAFVKDQTKDVPILQQQLASLGLYFLPASKDLSTGILRVKQALQYGQENGIITKSPEVFFFRTCTRTDYEFKRYVWDEWSVKMQEQRNAKSKPKDKDDHMMECLYRLLMLEPKYIPPDFDEEIISTTNKFTGY